MAGWKDGPGLAAIGPVRDGPGKRKRNLAGEE